MKVTKETKRDGIVLWTAEINVADVRALPESDLALVIGEALDQISYRTGKNKKALAAINADNKMVSLEDILAILRTSGDKNSGPSKDDKASAKAFLDKAWKASAPLVDMTKRRLHCLQVTSKRDEAMAATHTGGTYWDEDCLFNVETLAELFRHHRVSVDRDTRRKKAAQAAMFGEDLSPTIEPDNDEDDASETSAE